MSPSLPLTYILHDRKQPLIQPTLEFQSNAVLLREETGESLIYDKWAKPLVELARLFSWENQREAEMGSVKERDNRTSPSAEVEDINGFEFSNDLDDAMAQCRLLMQAIDSTLQSNLRALAQG